MARLTNYYIYERLTNLLLFQFFFLSYFVVVKKLILTAFSFIFLFLSNFRVVCFILFCLIAQQLPFNKLWSSFMWMCTEIHQYTTCSGNVHISTFTLFSDQKQTLTALAYWKDGMVMSYSLRGSFPPYL